MKKKYVVCYAKMQDDKTFGTTMTGIFFGGLCNDKKDADRIATNCVSKTQGGIVIPKVFTSHDEKLESIIKTAEKLFDELADSMYENERVFVKSN